jgi:uncharacterized membrane protein YoaK (UPF0700 family)
MTDMRQGIEHARSQGVRERPRPQRQVDQLTLGAMLVLTFSTGAADAVGYLALDKVFTGNMTGNVVILGMGAAGTPDLPVVGPALALGAFMAGAGLGGRSLRGSPSGWTVRHAVLLAVVGACFAAASAWLVAARAPEGGAAAYALTGGLAAAMGLQAVVARHLAVKDVTTVVVTSTITGLAADSWVAGRVGQPWPRRVAAVGLIGGGALVGALLVSWQVWAGVALPALLTFAVTAALAVFNRPVSEARWNS